MEDDAMDIDSEVDPSSLNYRQLQKACKAAGMSAQGTVEVLRERLQAYLQNPDEALRSHGKKKRAKATKEWVDWINHAAREILMEDIEPGGWLYGKDVEDARAIFEIYKAKQPEFLEVPFEQFAVRFDHATKQAAKRRARSAEEEEWMKHDREIYPRQSHNQRGEPVFDIDEEKIYRKTLQTYLAGS